MAHIEEHQHDDIEDIDEAFNYLNDQPTTNVVIPGGASEEPDQSVNPISAWNVYLYYIWMYSIYMTLSYDLWLYYYINGVHK